MRSMREDIIIVTMALRVRARKLNTTTNALQVSMPVKMTRKPRAQIPPTTTCQAVVKGHGRASL